ncbi:MAG: PTS transporter subunit EIIA [bacterium]|nr:PTS transporter subunit EIIA [bacterium]
MGGQSRRQALSIIEALNLPGANDMSPLMVLSVIVLVGGGGGLIARALRVPGITGNIIAGAILGFTLFRDIEVAKALQPLSTFAMSLIAVSVGGHLSYRRIHNALRRILTIALFESMVVVTVVTVALRYVMSVPWPVAALLGCMAVETAPATTVALIREARARGSFVKTLVSVVAVDNILCIMLFVFVETLDADYYDPETSLGMARALWDTVFQLGGSLAIGLGLGKITQRAVNHTYRFHNFSTSFVGILLCTGLSTYFGFSPLLTSLFFGMYFGNIPGEAENQLEILDPIQPLLHVCFFTLAGAALHLTELKAAGIVCIVYVAVRFAGKALGAWVGGVVSRSSKRIWSNMPLALMPQSAVAIGLVVVLEGDPRIPTEISSLVGALVLASVTVNEIVGPFLTRAALNRSREAGLDRPRLIEFLHEEFILTGLQAKDKWDALRKMTDFFVRTHNIPTDRRDSLYETVVERERSMTTAIGLGAAIPHGRIESGSSIRGVLGICRDGVDFDARDGEPVRLIMLIVTPEDHDKHHLEVMASLAGMVSSEAIRERLVAAIDANDAWEVIEDEEARGYNYFLEGEDGEPTSSEQ